jgi:DNA-binding NarL/FixJ family response regulator
MNQMVRKIGNTIEPLDQREIGDVNLSIQEQNQLNKMSLKKIVQNLRNKLNDEEAISKRLQTNMRTLEKEKQDLKEKFDNLKRERKMQEANQPLTKRASEVSAQAG